MGSIDEDDTLRRRRCPECLGLVGDDEPQALVGEQRWHRECLAAFDEYRDDERV